ncbi:MAG: hypothetical protein WAV10_00160, partial [Minisyncoccia bacterium]
MVKTVKADACVDMFGGILNQADHTYVLTGDLNGSTCIIYANNITIDADGFSINTIVSGNGTNGIGGGNGTNGFNFTIENALLIGSSLQSIGGSSSSGSGGNGGNITVRNSNIIEKVQSIGSSSYSGIPGSGGNILIENSTFHNTLVTNGGGTYGSENGGNGGSVTIRNSVSDLTDPIDGDSVAAYGGYSYSENGGNGGNVIVENSNLQGRINAYGGYGYYFFGNGGNVTITNSNINTIRNTGVVIGSLTITDDAPTVTLTGDENMTIAFEDVYAESGATAEDVKYTTTDLTGD